MKEKAVAVSIFLGSLVIALALYWGLTSRREKAGQEVSLMVTPTPSLSPSSVPSPLPSSSLSASPVPSITPEIFWRKSDLIAALSQKTNIPEDEISFSVGEEIKKTDRVLLKGGVSRQGEMGGAAFFALVNAQGVQVTFVGQGVPRCDEVNPYGYPLSWADYCLDENGQTVARENN